MLRVLEEESHLQKVEQSYDTWNHSHEPDINSSFFPPVRLLVPRLIVVPLSSHAVDGVRKEKERLTAAEIFPFLIMRSQPGGYLSYFHFSYTLLLATIGQKKKRK